VTAGEGWAIAVAVMLFGLAGFYRAAQTALSNMSMHRLVRMEEEGRRVARLRRLLENPARTVTILALVVLVMQVTATALVTVVAVRHLGGGAGVAVAAIATSVALFTGAEVAPKTLGLQRSERVASITAPFVVLLVRPLSPVASVLISIGNVIAPGRGLAQGPFVTEDEIREMIDVAEEGEVIEESERAMIHSIFELGDTIVREIMVPRPDMVMVSADDSLREVLDVMLRAGHSRIPVYRDERDRIVGLVYAKDVLRRLHTGGDEEGPWGDMLREPHFVPELKTVDDLLREMQTRKFHLAIVVDEYGATAGLVTIEDILEEIVGEIVDEYDREEALVEEIDEDLWRVDARLPVDELNELLSSALPDEEWDTVGGLLFGMLGHVPAPGERVEADTVRLTAERVKGRRIAKVIVERIPEGPVEATHAG
jgi:CBS domain containing-hemolysin-like protein